VLLVTASNTASLVLGGMLPATSDTRDSGPLHEQGCNRYVGDVSGLFECVVHLYVHAFGARLSATSDTKDSGPLQAQGCNRHACMLMCFGVCSICIL
jgi:hypothetical protein